MSFDPLGEIVEIVGINSNTNGCSCEEHHTCGCVYWKKTVSFDYESVKYTSMDMNKVRLEYIGCQMAWIDAL